MKVNDINFKYLNGKDVFRAMRDVMKLNYDSSERDFINDYFSLVLERCIKLAKDNKYKSDVNGRLCRLEEMYNISNPLNQAITTGSDTIHLNTKNGEKMNPDDFVVV